MEKRFKIGGILVLLALGLATPLAAQTIVATHTIRSQAILNASDVELIDQQTPGSYIPSMKLSVWGRASFYMRGGQFV